MAADHGFVVQRVEAPQSGSMIGALLTAAHAKGDLSQLIADALADGQISPNEADAIGLACALVQAAMVDGRQQGRAA